MSDDATKKHILKPGIHQFTPGSAAIHCNENLSDEEAEWYLQQYPHIAALFISRGSEGAVNENTSTKQSEGVLKKNKSKDKGGSA